MLNDELDHSGDEAWEEWEIRREADASWPDFAKECHADWWEQRIARQREIDASIAAKAEFEYLYDKPYEDNRKVRVAGPFTVESLSPHRVLGVDEDDELIDPREQMVAESQRYLPRTSRLRHGDARQPAPCRRPAGSQGGQNRVHPR